MLTKGDHTTSDNKVWAWENSENTHVFMFSYLVLFTKKEGYHGIVRASRFMSYIYDCNTYNCTTIITCMFEPAQDASSISENV